MPHRTTWNGCAGLPLGALALLATLMQAPPARAANPGSAAYSRAGDRLFWILHVSDTHIGAQWILDVYDETARFAWLLDEGVAVINPSLVVHTGDLVDGSPNGIPGSGQDDAEWAEYRDLVDTAGMTPDVFLDLAGNHDGYGDPGLTHYLASSLQGETYGETTRSLPLQFPFGSYLVYGAATAGDDGAVFLDHAEWSGAELADLTAALTAHAASDLILVFGHHPFKEPANGDQAENLLQQHQALYFHGHVHASGSYLESNVWSAQVNTLGKGKTDNVAVIAVDNNAVSYAVTSSENPWPFVVVTAPADRRLDSGEVSPYAYSVCQSGTHNPVRALVFDLVAPSAVTVSAGGGAAVPMTRDPQEPRLWHGAWDASSLTPGEITLTVTATGTTTRSREVSVLLEDVPCPEDPPPPDAGVPDAGPADATVDASPDAGPRMDAFVFPDGTLPPRPEGPSQGCSCDAGGAPDPGTLFPLLWLGLLGVLARRRPGRPS